VIIREHTNVSTFDISLLVPDDFKMGDVIYGIENSDPRIKGLGLKTSTKGRVLRKVKDQSYYPLELRIEI